jgi:hypothetical protein
MLTFPASNVPICPSDPPIHQRLTSKCTNTEIQPPNLFYVRECVFNYLSRIQGVRMTGCCGRKFPTIRDGLDYKISAYWIKRKFGLTSYSHLVLW